MSKISITIIGCGWLGKKLAKVLISEGHILFGSTTKKEHLCALESIGIHPFILSNEEPIIPHEVIENSDFAIITIPPFDREHPQKYGNYLATISRQFTSKTHQIFTSSTGIYPQKSGEYDETYPFLPEERNLHYWAETAIRKNSKKHTILRLGGLFDTDRHPIHTISKRRTISNPQGFVNLVHRMDVIRFIQHLIEAKCENTTFNIVYPSHPQRIAYYTRCAKHFNYPIPTGESTNHQLRIITSKKSTLINRFSYNYNIYHLDK